MERSRICQYSLLASFLAYLAAFHAITPRKASPLRLAASREALSIFHCTSMTILVAICLYRELPSTISPRFKPEQDTQPVADRELPIITRKSEFANVLTAIETAYLLQDSVVLIFAARGQRGYKKASTTGKSSHAKALRGLNFRHLGWHHALLGSAFLYLQSYIASGTEKGILIIVAMLLMNASSPFGTLRWFLLNFQPGLKSAIKFLSVAYLIAFATFRVGLIYYILKVFGQQLDMTAAEAFWRLRAPCKMGMSSLGLVNTAWFLIATRSFLLREFFHTQSSRVNN